MADINVKEAQEEIKIFKMDEYTWIAASDLDGAFQAMAGFFGCKSIDEYKADYPDDEPRELTNEEMDTLYFIEDSGDGLRTGEKKTFRQKLGEMIGEGEKFPCFFASTEY